MIDLAMPRDIDPAVQDLEGVYLCDLDSLRTIAERARSVRQQESVKCRQIIDRHVHEFECWMDSSPVLNFSSVVPNAMFSDDVFA
jgi:glutamyl-tRNA reductase